MAGRGPRALEARHYLIDVHLTRLEEVDGEAYPFNLPAVRALNGLRFHPSVTFLVGENGSGKSTIVEALAVACGLNPEGGSRNFNFSTRASHSPLHRHLRLARSPWHIRDSFFLRAESYFNVASNIEEMDREPLGGPPIISSYGGRSLHEQSHGESFFALFLNRLGGQGLYILDEPEAALSPMRQLQFLARLHELVGQQSQFIIATHSPILMGYPDARILQLSQSGIEEVAWRETEHYRLTRRFLENPRALLDIMLAP